MRRRERTLLETAISHVCIYIFIYLFIFSKSHFACAQVEISRNSCRYLPARSSSSAFFF